MEINVLISRGFQKYFAAGWLKDLARAVLTAEQSPAQTAIGLVVTGQKRIRELNKQYRGEDTPTDVLSFPMLELAAGKPVFSRAPDGKIHLGEVIISCPQAVKQAKDHGHSLKKEVVILLIHGILHLLGYDHDTPSRQRRMRARETEFLKLIEGKGL